VTNAWLIAKQRPKPVLAEIGTMDTGTGRADVIGGCAGSPGIIILRVGFEGLMDGVIVVDGNEQPADRPPRIVACIQADGASDLSAVASIERSSSPASRAHVALASVDGGHNGHRRPAGLREADGALWLLTARP
jgi:hypothetical protein